MACTESHTNSGLYGGSRERHSAVYTQLTQKRCNNRPTPVAFGHNNVSQVWLLNRDFVDFFRWFPNHNG